MRWNNFSLWFNLAAFLTLLASLGLMLLWPAHLATLGLSALEGKLLCLQLISLMLLMGGFQTSLGHGWRYLSLTASFVVLSESTLLALLIPN